MQVSFKIFCPKGVRTGGPEALHQLADSLVTLGKDVEIVYFGNLEGNDAFPEYDVPKVSKFRKGNKDLVVVPEVSTHLLPKLGYWKSAIYWLSVDNYLKSRIGLLNAYTPSRLRRYISSIVNRGYDFAHGFCVDYHLYQSEYAKLFLLKSLRSADGRIFEITDYLSSAYQDCAGSPTTAQEKRDWIAYNPKKLGEIGEALLNRLPEQSLKPILNLDQNGVVDLLRQCKIYIDFGPHPGMDRIPREAAACGCLVLVGERGSASYFSDVPLPAEYKIDLRNPDMDDLVRKINKMLANYDGLLGSVSRMRKNVIMGRDRFNYQVRRWIAEEDL